MDANGETNWSSLQPRTSVVDGCCILQSMTVQEIDGELGGAAEGVLQRTANLLAVSGRRLLLWMAEIA